MNGPLLEKLQKYAASQSYPFHMPGHKRNPEISYFPVHIDLTEIDGFDNLHHPEGILKEAQERAAQLYGSSECFFLVNGSTCGILAAISAAVPKNGRLAFARNSHKAAYHAVFLRDLQPEYLYPKMAGTCGNKQKGPKGRNDRALMEDRIGSVRGICGEIKPEEVEKTLKRCPDIRAVFITSPTYEGMVSDIEKIADITHRYSCILVVDEAHGSHLGLDRENDFFPKSAVSCGADLVIQSLHKTLPAPTQTAVLHVNGDRVDREKLRTFLQIYQTSSPSYVLMAAMDACINYVSNNKNELFKIYRERLACFYKQADSLCSLFVLSPQMAEKMDGIWRMDPSKICIFSGNSGFTGDKLYQMFLQEFHLQMEMAAGAYVLAMTSVMDTQSGFDCLLYALGEVDCRADKEGLHNITFPDIPKPRIVMTQSQAEIEKKAAVSLMESQGFVSAEYRYIYPPGVPVLVPGEQITSEVLELFSCYEQCGLTMLGGQGDGKKIMVVENKNV